MRFYTYVKLLIDSPDSSFATPGMLQLALVGVNPLLGGEGETLKNITYKITSIYYSETQKGLFHWFLKQVVNLSFFVG